MSGNLALMATAESVAPGVTVFFICVLIGLIVCLAFEEKLHAKKSIIAGVFAVFSLLMATMFGLMPFDKVVVGSHEAAPLENEIELDVYTDESHEQNRKSCHFRRQA